ncbi:MAG: secretin N-terminal domain-containing protein, partial [Opitutaceae bacterium]
ELRYALAEEQLALASKPRTKPGELVENIEKILGWTLVSLNRNQDRPVVQFHPGSNLLIVTGTDTAVDLTRKVIAALERNP